MVLHFPRHGQVTLHALLFTRDKFIERCILDSNRHLRCQCAHGAQMIFSEIAPARMFKIKNADDLVLIYKRTQSSDRVSGLALI